MSSYDANVILKYGFKLQRKHVNIMLISGYLKHDIVLVGYWGMFFELIIQVKIMLRLNNKFRY